MLKLNYTGLLFALVKARSLPGTLMGAFLRVEAAGMVTTADDKSDERWLPNLYSVFHFKIPHYLTFINNKSSFDSSHLRGI